MDEHQYTLRKLRQDVAQFSPSASIPTITKIKTYDSKHSWIPITCILLLFILLFYLS